MTRNDVTSQTAQPSSSSSCSSSFPSLSVPNSSSSSSSSHLSPPLSTTTSTSHVTPSINVSSTLNVSKEILQGGTQSATSSTTPTSSAFGHSSEIASQDGLQSSLIAKTSLTTAMIKSGSVTKELTSMSNVSASDGAVSSSDDGSELKRKQPLENSSTSSSLMTMNRRLSPGESPSMKQSQGITDLSSNEASTTASPIKRAVTTDSSPPAILASSGDIDTHGTPAKRIKRTSSSFKSTNSNKEDDGITQPLLSLSSTTAPAASALASSHGVKDTTTNTSSSVTGTSNSSIITTTTMPPRHQQVPQTQSCNAAGHEDITDSEEEDEGKMMIDEDASSDREAATNSPGPRSVPPLVITSSVMNNSGTNQVAMSKLVPARSEESISQSSPSSSSPCPPLQLPQSKVSPNSPTSTESPSDGHANNSMPISGIQQSNVPKSMPISSLKVPPIRIVISKSIASSSPTVTAVQATSSLDPIGSSGQKVSSSSTNLNTEFISSSSSSSSNSSQSTNVSSSAVVHGSQTVENNLVTGSGLNAAPFTSGTGTSKNQVSSSSVSSLKDSGGNKECNEGVEESESDDGSENGSLGSVSGTGNNANNSGGKNGKSSDKTDSSKTRSGSKDNSTGRVTRSSQRVAAREKDGNHSSGSAREASHRLRDRKKGDFTGNENRDSPSSGQDQEGNDNHSVISPTSSSKDGSNETGATESAKIGGPGRKRKTRQTLRGKDGDRGTPEKTSKRVKELIKEDSNQGSNQGDDQEDNDSTSSSTSSTGPVAGSDQQANTNGSSSIQSNVTGLGGDQNNGNVTIESSCAIPPTSFQMPSYNSYQMYLNIRKQVERRRKTLVPVTPKAPTGFKNYLLNRGNYLLHGKVAASSSLTNNVNLTGTSGNNENYNSYGFISCNSNTTSYKLPMKLSPPQGLIPGSPLYNLFLQQENDRQKVRIQHTIEREKLRLSVEQEVLRVHGRAALAMANQSVPLSVCSILKDEEIYNTIEPLDGEGNSSPGHGSEDGKGSNDYSKSFSNLGVNASQGADLSALTGAPPAPGSRLRYNGRILVQWLADVSDKWDKIKVETLKRQRRESESLVAIQKLDWEWKMKELKLCDFKSTPIIHPDLIPNVDVTDDFHLLPSN